VPLHGSSDPFDVFTVKITPKKNRLIVFVRDVVLSSTFIPRYMRHLSLGASKNAVFDIGDRVLGGSNLMFTLRHFADLQEGRRSRFAFYP
jgi:hypothetical protein